ncbi:MAG: DUF2061 domain-containing protein [Bacteroidales bacterium]
MENKKRSIIKAISWRLLGTIDTMIISWLITGKFVLAISIGGTELLTKTLLYYAHERVWNRIKFGRKTEEDYVI